ncbi:peroxiredoxin family protein [Parendozoicomonas haliclonae]|uniref:Glutathione-dependent peroxiredoxin n=1 Tax=Parendozoicomonas haliclonae TaxID=1960125 RepID=A0A1X7ANX0_9GAMM|nr:peroxiredoxin [Parendozoicomonas haliclonae]SMA49798.1 putative peroxiredoxin [Parendozoicomonas haliclonae]
MEYIGQTLPDITVYEFAGGEDTSIAIGPLAWRLPDLAFKKKVLVIGLPGAFTSLCNGTHMPGFLDHYQDFLDLGFDELWCIAVNDAFVMHAWGQSLGVNGRVRMLSDGSAEFVRAMDVTLDLTDKGMGVRSDRFAMVLENGVITFFVREEPGLLQMSDADTILSRLQNQE